MYSLQEKAEMFDFMVSNGFAVIHHYDGYNKKYWLYKHSLGAKQIDEFDTPEQAIKEAMQKEMK